MARGLLEVFLVSAKGLGDSDFIGRMDPYVLIKYKNQERKSSVASEEGGCPVWNERHTFLVDYPGMGSEYKLTLRIMDRDTFSADDFVGESVIYVKELLISGIENGTAKLHPSKYCVVRADGTYSGELQVGVTFTHKVENERDMAEYGGWNQSNY
ncbi:hypothetical protein ACHQM5_021304 [Ranunculus cassubicifolius]